MKASLQMFPHERAIGTMSTIINIGTMSRLLAQEPGVMNQPERHGPGMIDDGMGGQQSVGVMVSGLRNVHTDTYNCKTNRESVAGK